MSTLSSVLAPSITIYSKSVQDCVTTDSIVFLRPDALFQFIVIILNFITIIYML